MSSVILEALKYLHFSFVARLWTNQKLASVLIEIILPLIGTT